MSKEKGFDVQKRGIFWDHLIFEMSEIFLLYNCWEKEHVYSLGELKHNEMQSKNMQTYYLPEWLNSSNQKEDRNRGFIYSDFGKMTPHLYLDSTVPAST